jgi:uncharacterized protein (DUF2132 family)
MSEEQPNNPLHGLTLETVLTRLVEHYGWESLGRRIRINCFSVDPSIRSSLVFLRRTPWARLKVERLYLRTRFDRKDAGRRVGNRSPRQPRPARLPRAESPEIRDTSFPEKENQEKPDIPPS